jgi:hypothetical protein
LVSSAKSVSSSPNRPSRSTWSADASLPLPLGVRAWRITSQRSSPSISSSYRP